MSLPPPASRDLRTQKQLHAELDQQASRGNFFLSISLCQEFLRGAQANEMTYPGMADIWECLRNLHQ